MCKISFIVPVYNTASYLRRCINSIISQHYHNYELILINDGSTDSSLEICREYAGNSKVLIITQPNSGVSAARNAGIKIATGDYFFFVDSDDWIEEQSLEYISEFLDNNDVDVLRIKCNTVKKGYVVSDLWHKTGKIDTDVLMKRKYFCPALWGYLFKASIIRENRIVFVHALKYSEDSNFIFKCLCKSKNIYLINSRTYNYNVREDSAIHQNFTIEWAEANLVALLDLMKFQSNIPHSFQKRIILYYMEAYFVMLFRVGKYSKKEIYNNYRTFCDEVSIYFQSLPYLFQKSSMKFFEIFKIIFCATFFSYRLKVRLMSLWIRKTC